MGGNKKLTQSQEENSKLVAYEVQVFWIIPQMTFYFSMPLVPSLLLKMLYISLP